MNYSIVARKKSFFLVIVSGGKWEIILGRWGWVGHYSGWVGEGG